MSEGQHFEVPPKSHEPQSIEALLEKGEIIHSKPLEGFERFDVVEIKDDGKGLFRPDNEKTYERDFGRSDLELTAFVIDRILGFDLVPTIVTRNIEGKTGSLQRFIRDDGFEMACLTESDWRGLVDDTELIKAAVFDYLLGARDRRKINFMINKVSRRIKLIDHDRHMILEERFGGESEIVQAVVERGLSKVPEEIMKGIRALLERIDSIVGPNTRPVIKNILDRVKTRAGILITTGTLS